MLRAIALAVISASLVVIRPVPHLRLAKLKQRSTFLYSFWFVQWALPRQYLPILINVSINKKKLIQLYMSTIDGEKYISYNNVNEIGYIYMIMLVSRGA